MLRKWLAALALLSSAAVAQEVPRPSLAELSQQARAAREAGDYPGYLRAVEALRDLMPWSPAMAYNMARAYALNGRRAEANATLGKLADAGWGFDAANDPVLTSLKGDAIFTQVASRLAANNQPHGAATAQRKLALAGKQPEGIAATSDGTLYVGALRDGIYRIDSAGLTKLYTPGPGLGVVGLRVDEARRELLACLGNDRTGKSRFVRLALPDLAPRTAIDFPAPNAFCNDSTLLPDGRVAITDSTGGRLWVANRDRLTEVKTSTPLYYPNGVAFGGGRLYVAHAAGLLIVDPATGDAAPVKAGATSLIGIDGLIWHDDALVAVQNGAQPIRILRITPPAALADAAKVEVLAAGHPALNGATTAAAVGDMLLVLSQTGIPVGSLPDDPMLVEVPISR